MIDGQNKIKGKDIKQIKFRGEKKLFVEREEYINNEIKAKFSNNNIVSIFDIGGIGKTQLVYKATHKYQDECMFGIVIPIYFSTSISKFQDFLTDISQKLGIQTEECDKLNEEEKKSLYMIN